MPLHAPAGAAETLVWMRRRGGQDEQDRWDERVGVRVVCFRRMYRSWRARAAPLEIVCNGQSKNATDAVARFSVFISTRCQPFNRMVA